MEKGKLYIEYIPLSKLKKWPRNPKLHSLKEIGESIDRFGFADPVTVDEETGYLVAGHGREEELSLKLERGENPPRNIKVDEAGEWLVPVVRGNHFENEKELEAYLLTVNALTENGGWDEELLGVIIPEVEPIGFEFLEDVHRNVDEAIDAIEGDEYDGPVYGAQDPVTGIIPSKITGEKGVADARLDIDGLKRGAGLNTDSGDTPKFEDVPGVLQGVWEMSENLPIFGTENELGIPELLPSMILEEIPQPLRTWGSKTESPDDGTSYYFYNFGATQTTGLPYSRALMAYYTHDRHLEVLWNNPAYRVGQKLVAGIVGCVVPDFSFWKGDPKALHIYNAYRAQYMGRFMQDAGLKVVPRFEYFLPEVRDFSLLGVPRNSPTMAVQLHTTLRNENTARVRESLIEGLNILRPKQLLVYASVVGEEIIDEVRGELAVEDIIIVPSAKRIRRPPDSWKETDPHLLKLRNMKYDRRDKGREEEMEEA